jgi:hypothetical protein
LSQQALDGPGQGQTDMTRETPMLFSEGQENPAVLKNIQSPRQVPKRREDDGDLFPDPGQFLKECGRLFDMFQGVRAEDGLELIVLKRQVIDRIDQPEIGQARMSDDIRVDPAAIGFSAADVEIPFPLAENASLEDPIAQEIESLGEDGQGQQEQDPFHKRRHCSVDRDSAAPLFLGHFGRLTISFFTSLFVGRKISTPRKLVNRFPEFRAAKVLKMSDEGSHLC